MKCLGLVAGLVALVAAGSANATTIYDTLSGQTAIASNAIGTNAPLGADFSVAYTQVLSSLTLGLVDKSTSCGTTTVGANCTDNGSILVYLVSSTAGLPSSSGLTLTNAIELGSISDKSLLYSTGNTLNNVTLSTNVTVTAGTWWIELVNGSTASTAKWGEIMAPGATGTVGTPTSGWYTSGPGATGNIIGGIGNDSTPSVPSPNDQLFAMTVNTPEPATLSIIGAGLFGLGWTRRRKAKKTS